MGIREEYKKIKYHTFKDRREQNEAFRQIANEIVQKVTNKDYPPTDSELFIGILNQVGSLYPASSHLFIPAADQLISEKLKPVGIENVEVVWEKTQTVSIEGGSIGVGDPTFERGINFGDFSEERLKQIETDGKRLFIRTGEDGQFTVHLRLIKAHEPILPSTEYKFLTEATDEITLHIESGKISVGDAIVSNPQPNPFIVKIDPGSYKTRGFLLQSPKLKGYCVVICKK